MTKIQLFFNNFMPFGSHLMYFHPNTLESFQGVIANFWRWNLVDDQTLHTRHDFMDENALAYHISTISNWHYISCGWSVVWNRNWTVIVMMALSFGWWTVNCRVKARQTHNCVYTRMARRHSDENHGFIQLFSPW